MESKIQSSEATVDTGIFSFALGVAERLSKITFHNNCSTPFSQASTEMIDSSSVSKQTDTESVTILHKYGFPTTASYRPETLPR
ncbi:hypothetical protein H5410_020682 [Solanum commersonii]|uniref:Uncharacterized protein n=1 Tax=Solanum commersonii TaxID=4109 RepID=A0A9J5Z956_SOLCO|nr:hypothetical protein H5410_020682 [Solanum commersonii]